MVACRDVFRTLKTWGRWSDRSGGMAGLCRRGTDEWARWQHLPAVITFFYFFFLLPHRAYCSNCSVHNIRTQCIGTRIKRTYAVLYQTRFLFTQVHNILYIICVIYILCWKNARYPFCKRVLMCFGYLAWDSLLYRVYNILLLLYCIFCFGKILCLGKDSNGKKERERERMSGKRT